MLVKKGVATEQELVALIAKAANIPPIDLSKLILNKDVLESVPEDVARDYGVFPVDKIGSIITIAVANPFDVLKLDDIRIVTGCQLRLVVSTEEEIERTRGKNYQQESDSVDGIAVTADGHVWLSHTESPYVSHLRTDGRWAIYPNRQTAVALAYETIKQTLNSNKLWAVAGDEVWVDFDLFNGQTGTIASLPVPTPPYCRRRRQQESGLGA